MQVENNLEMKIHLESQFKNGISWFYWIAGLSIINTLVLYFNGDISFMVGLGITQLIDVIAFELTYALGKNLLFYGVVINLIISLFFVLIGKLGAKRKKVVIIIGMVIYALDALIFLIANDYLSIGFHIFALYGIFKGLKACNQLIALENSPIDDILPPQE